MYKKTKFKSKYSHKSSRHRDIEGNIIKATPYDAPTHSLEFPRSTNPKKKHSVLLDAYGQNPLGGYRTFYDCIPNEFLPKEQRKGPWC